MDGAAEAVDVALGPAEAGAVVGPRGLLSAPTGVAVDRLPPVLLRLRPRCPPPLPLLPALPTLFVLPWRGRVGVVLLAGAAGCGGAAAAAAGRGEGADEPPTTATWSPTAVLSTAADWPPAAPLPPAVGCAGWAVRGPGGGGAAAVEASTAAAGQPAALPAPAVGPAAAPAAAALAPGPDPDTGSATADDVGDVAVAAAKRSTGVGRGPTGS